MDKLFNNIEIVDKKDLPNYKGYSFGQWYYEIVAKLKEKEDNSKDFFETHFEYFLRDNGFSYDDIEDDFEFLYQNNNYPMVKPLNTDAYNFLFK